MTRVRCGASLGVAALVLVAGCSSDAGQTDGADSGRDADAEPPAFIADVREAVSAVEAELGSGQKFFEVTANQQFTNVFVAVDGGTAAISYTYVDDTLQAPAPKQDGASGQTFSSDEIDFVDHRILSGVGDELADSEIDAISVYGNEVGVTYVLAASSPAGGFLDIVVGPEGAIFSVEPV